MKTKLFLFLLLTSFITNAQNSKIEFENFKLQDDKKIVWQKIFEINDANKDSIVKILDNYKTSSSFLNNLSLKDYSLTGLSNYVKISDVSNLPLAAQSEYNCFVVIDVKDNKYRVTVKNLTFKPLKINMGIVDINHVYPLEELTVRNNHHEIRKNKTARRVLSNINKDLIQIFTIKPIKKDDW